MTTPLDTDVEFKEYKIKSVDVPGPDEKDHYFIINATDGGSLCISNPDQKSIPRNGQIARFYGRGFGYSVRGVSVGEVVYYYITAEEEKEQRRVKKIEDAAKKTLEWEAALPENTARIEAMPAPFQKRILFFMRSSEWGPTFGKYELFVCSEAIKIAAVCTDADDVSVFSQDRARQASVINDDHSGNTFGAACNLAALFLQSPDMLWKEHGALCPLVGCEGYGCFANTDPVEQLALSERFSL